MDRDGLETRAGGSTDTAISLRGGSKFVYVDTSYVVLLRRVFRASVATATLP